MTRLEDKIMTDETKQVLVVDDDGLARMEIAEKGGRTYFPGQLGLPLPLKCTLRPMR